MRGEENQIRTCFLWNEANNLKIAASQEELSLNIRLVALTGFSSREKMSFYYNNLDLAAATQRGCSSEMTPFPIGVGTNAN